MTQVESSDSSTTAEWYFERDGKQVGPLTATQIYDLYKKQELTADHPITSARLEGKGDWMSVAELLAYLHENQAAINAAAAVPTFATGSKSFSPPPRPELLPQQMGTDEPKLSGHHTPHDHSFALYEAYQASRDKKHGAKFVPPPPAEIVRSETFAAIKEQVTPRLMVLVGMGLILLAGVVSGVRWIAKQTSQPTTANIERKNSTTAPSYQRPNSSGATRGSLSSLGSGKNAAPAAASAPASRTFTGNGFSRASEDHPSERGDTPIIRDESRDPRDARDSRDSRDSNEAQESNEPPPGHYQSGNPSVMNETQVLPQAPLLQDPNAGGTDPAAQQP